MFWYSLVGADRPLKQAMPVARDELGCVCPLVALSVATIRSTLEKRGIVC